MTYYVQYKPVDLRTPDDQYRSLLQRIKDNGEWYPNQMGEDAKTLFGQTLYYPFANGAPIIGLRDLVMPSTKTGRSYFSQALGEITAFVNGADTQEQLESFGCYWWNNWLSEAKCKKRGLEPGQLGPGSYGAAWTNFPTNNGGFNQITALVQQIKENPQLRTHMITPWVPQFVFRATGYQQKVVVVPCHGWLLVRINTRIKSFTLIHWQRSADVPVGLPANLIGYTAFALMLAKVTGYRADGLVFQIADAHYYDSQQEAVDALISQGPEILPTLRISADKPVITDYRANDFVISNYSPQGPRSTIPTPV